MSFSENSSVSVNLENSWKFFEKDPFSDQSIDFARMVAAYYLGLPLLASRNPGQLPSLYEWPKSSSEINMNEYLVLKRVNVAKAISSMCDERTPPVLLWACNHHIEAIYYCDQFRDLKSQAVLRFLEEQLTGLKLLEVFCESRIDIAFKEFDGLVGETDYGIMQNMRISWSKLADSLLQMDAITETRAACLLHDRILAKMFGIHAKMPLFVDADIPLPRPPVYMYLTCSGVSEEQHCYARLWILIQAYAYLLSDANVLLPCIEYFCRNFLKFNTQREDFDRKFLTKNCYKKFSTKPLIFWIRGFLKFTLIILRLVARDTATMEHRHNVVFTNLTKRAIAKYHDLLNVEEGEDEDDLLAKWTKKADWNDFKQLSHLFDYLRTFRSPFAYMTEFCTENITCWRNHLLKEVKFLEEPDNNEKRQHLQVNAVKTRVPNGVLMKAEYIARCWPHPIFAVDERLLAMNLKLCPSDFVSGTTQNVTTFPPRQVSLIEFAPQACHHSVPDIRHHIERPPAETSRSLPRFTPHFKSKDASIVGGMNSWRKLDIAMQKMNVMIEQVEQELESTSYFVKALLNNQRKTPAESRANSSDGGSKSQYEHISPSKTSKTTIILEQYEFVNDDRYSLDSSREPEQYSEIERLNFDLLSPHPVVRKTVAIDATTAQTQKTQPPITRNSQRFATGASPLPLWLKLLPAEQKNFLLSLTPTVNQSEENKNRQ